MPKQFPRYFKRAKHSEHLSASLEVCADGLVSPAKDGARRSGFFIYILDLQKTTIDSHFLISLKTTFEIEFFETFLPEKLDQLN